MTKLSLNDEKLKEWMDSYVKKNRFNGCSLSIADIDGNTLLDIASGHADKEKTKEFNSLSIHALSFSSFKFNLVIAYSFKNL